MECGGQTNGEGAQEARGGSWGVEEGFWNPGGRRRGSRGELQGPCNHCFAEGTFAKGQCNLVAVGLLILWPKDSLQNDACMVHYIGTGTWWVTELTSLPHT